MLGAQQIEWQLTLNEFLLEAIQEQQDNNNYVSALKYQEVLHKNLMHMGDLVSTSDTFDFSVIVEETQDLAAPQFQHLESENKNRWTFEEHTAFLEALEQFGNDARKINEAIPTRELKQVRSHLQKHLQKLKKEEKNTNTTSEPINKDKEKDNEQEKDKETETNNRDVITTI